MILLELLLIWAIAIGVGCIIAVLAARLDLPSDMDEGR